MSPQEFVNAYSLVKNKEVLESLIAALEKHHIAKTSELRELIEGKIWISGLTTSKRSELLEYFNETYPEEMFVEQAMGAQYISEAELPSSVKTPVKEYVPSENSGFVVPTETLGSSKYIYGTYLEMAFHNFFLNMKHIYALVFGLDIELEAATAYEAEKHKTFDGDFANERYVWQPMFNDFRSARPEEKLKLEQLIDRHFPFVKVVLDYFCKHKEFFKYKGYNAFDILEHLSESLRILRNFYSHFDIKLHDNQRKTYNDNELLVRGVIKATYVKSIDTVKERFSLEDKDLDFTKCKNGEGTRKADFKYYITDKDNRHLTRFGLIMLTSLFLEKQYSKILLDKSRHLPSTRSVSDLSSSSNEQKYIPEIIAVYRLRLHTEKLHVESDADALALDMLTELRRCPKELYEHLSPTDRKSFRVKGVNESDDEVLMLRHSDRFATMAMKYIDYRRQFQRIRFQVSLGNYFFKFYNKYCIDGGESRVRALSKHVNGFGRINEMDEARRTKWGETIRTYETVHCNTANEQPYITDQYPQYTESDGHIVMRIFENTALEPRLHVPTLEADGVYNLEPTCRLSTYALPAMMMLMHLRGADYVEKTIIEAVDSFHRLFNDVASGELQPVEDDSQLQTLLAKNYPHIQLQGVPQDIRDYLTGYFTDSKEYFCLWADATIDHLIEETHHKIKQIKPTEKPQRGRAQKTKSASSPALKPGNMAEFLAKDIMRFQPFTDDNKGKLTGLNFRVFQAELAQYNGDVDHLNDLLKNAHIIETADRHHSNPVVTMMGPIKFIRSVEQFYKKYLRSRLNYLKNCKRNRNYGEYSFLHANQTRWQEHTDDFYRQKAARYLHDSYGGREFDKAIELPRGLFDDSLRQALSQTKVGALANDATKNISYLIYAFCQKELTDECQPMYGKARNYLLFDRICQEKTKEKKFFSIEQLREGLRTDNKQSFKKRIAEVAANSKRSLEEKKDYERLFAEMKNNETLLKRYRVQDIVLFVLAKDILTANQNDVKRVEAFRKLKLKDMQTPGVLDQKISFGVKVSSKRGYEKTIVQEDLKLKNYAQFYRFLNDHRIASLLDLVKDNRISRKLIEEELNGHDTVHLQVIDKVMQFERQFLTKHGEEEWPREASNLIFWKMLQHETQIENNPLGKVRNAFAHAVYPKWRDISETAKNKDLPEKAKQIGDDFNEEIDSIMH